MPRLSLMPPFVRFDFVPPVVDEVTNATTMAYAYLRFGAAALVLVGVVLLSEQRVLGQVFAAEQRAEELQLRVEDMAKLHIGLLNTMIRTLDLRDRMTARHSAAVAHYAREIAAAIGMSKGEQQVVHTAGLLHDIGKFNLPDTILKADGPLDEDDWRLIREHPAEGARLVSYLEGYDDAAEIIRAHHERFEGGGYPEGLRGLEIPLGARVISVADTYDVITARDSYRRPMTQEEASRVGAGRGRGAMGIAQRPRADLCRRAAGRLADRRRQLVAARLPWPDAGLVRRRAGAASACVTTRRSAQVRRRGSPPTPLRRRRTDAGRGGRRGRRRPCPGARRSHRPSPGCG